MVNGEKLLCTPCAVLPYAVDTNKSVGCLCLRLLYFCNYRLADVIEVQGMKPICRGDELCGDEDQDLSPHFVGSVSVSQSEHRKLQVTKAQSFIEHASL